LENQSDAVKPLSADNVLEALDKVAGSHDVGNEDLTADEQHDQQQVNEPGDPRIADLNVNALSLVHAATACRFVDYKLVRADLTFDHSHTRFRR